MACWPLVRHSQARSWPGTTAQNRRRLRHPLRRRGTQKHFPSRRAAHSRLDDILKTGKDPALFHQIRFWSEMHWRTWKYSEIPRRQGYATRMPLCVRLAPSMHRVRGRTTVASARFPTPSLSETTGSRQQVVTGDDPVRNPRLKMRMGPSAPSEKGPGVAGPPPGLEKDSFPVGP
jgi:hypothetical protein